MATRTTSRRQYVDREELLRGVERCADYNLRFARIMGKPLHPWAAAAVKALRGGKPAKVGAGRHRMHARTRRARRSGARAVRVRSGRAVHRRHRGRLLRGAEVTQH